MGLLLPKEFPSLPFVITSKYMPPACEMSTSIQAAGSGSLTDHGSDVGSSSREITGPMKISMLSPSHVLEPHEVVELIISLSTASA